jgi:hypothetical protein
MRYHRRKLARILNSRNEKSSNARNQKEKQKEETMDAIRPHLDHPLISPNRLAVIRHSKMFK